MGAGRAGGGKAPTLRAVAQLAGVSHVTVSLALRNDPRISAATRRRVKSIAQRAGYAPDPRVAELMGHLRQGRARLPATAIAFLSFEHPVYGVQDSPTAQRFLRGAQVRAQQLGYRLERFVVGEGGLSEQRVMAILRTRNIRGALIAPLSRDIGRLQLEWDRLAVVAFGHSLVEPRLHRVSSYHAHTMRLALRQLEARGYHRPGVYLREGLNARVDEAWLAAYFFHWYACHPGQTPIPPLVGESWSRTGFQRWYRAHQPDGVITIQLSVLDWLKTDAAVPQTAGFALLDWSREMGDVAGVDQQSERVGAAALEQVAAHLAQHEYGIPASPKTIWIEGAWHEGRTVRPGLI